MVTPDATTCRLVSETSDVLAGPSPLLGLEVQALHLSVGCLQPRDLRHGDRVGGEVQGSQWWSYWPQMDRRWGGGEETGYDGIMDDLRAMLQRWQDHGQRTKTFVQKILERSKILNEALERWSRSRGPRHLCRTPGLGYLLPLGHQPFQHVPTVVLFPQKGTAVMNQDAEDSDVIAFHLLFPAGKPKTEIPITVGGIVPRKKFAAPKGTAPFVTWGPGRGTRKRRSS